MSHAAGTSKSTTLMLGHASLPTSRKSISVLQTLKQKNTNNLPGNGAEIPGPTILIEHNKICVRIPVQNILFIRSEHVYCRIFFINDQRVLQRISLEKIMTQLPQDRFLRIHRSYVINLDYVMKFTTKKVFVGENAITIGRTRKEQVLQRLKEIR